MSDYLNKLLVVFPLTRFLAFYQGILDHSIIDIYSNSVHGIIHNSLMVQAVLF